MKMNRPNCRDNVLTTEERKRMASSVKTMSEQVVVMGLLYTGMRISEFLHMKRDWIDFKDGIIHIPFNMPCRCSTECVQERYTTKKNGSSILAKSKNTWQCKTKRGERSVPMLPEIRDILNSYFLQHDDMFYAASNRVDAWRIVKNVGKRARIGHKCFPHCLRATFATMLVEKGLEDAIMLTQVMGWVNVNMAQTYIRLSGQAMKKKIDALWHN